VQWILKGPETAGYLTGLWTCRRVAQVVPARFGVIYHRLGAHLVCLDETGFMMAPVLRRT
jgi:hypothetical protein